MDIVSYVPVMVLAVATISLYINSSSKYFTAQAHESYKATVLRELNQIHDRVKILEATRPTTGELEARFDRNGIHLKK
jgi:hypothetical protein